MKGKTLSKNSLAISLLPDSSLQGRRIMALVQPWSVMVRMVLCPLDGGSLVMKSTAMWENGIGSPSGIMESRGGTFRCVIVLFAWQVAHPLTYSSTSHLRVGHQ
jgi:hypothetical protein